MAKSTARTARTPRTPRRPSAATAATATAATEKAPKTPKVPKEKPCACLTGTGTQCDGITTKVFARGHDARMSSRLANQVAEGRMPMAKAINTIREAGGGDLLIDKTKHSAELRMAKAQSTGTPKAPRKPRASRAAKKAGETAAPPPEDAEAAEDDLDEEIEDEDGAEAEDLDEDEDEDDAEDVASAAVGSKVTVKHGSREFNAVVVRDGSGDLKARHRFQGKNCDHTVAA